MDGWTKGVKTMAYAGLYDKTQPEVDVDDPFLEDRELPFPGERK